MQNHSLQTLRDARRLARYAVELGFRAHSATTRGSGYGHLGAIMADTALQSGVNYTHVVQPRIRRILIDWPETAELHGLHSIVNECRSAEYLNWRGTDKIERFVSLYRIFNDADIATTTDLREWLEFETNRSTLGHLRGFGPKSVDYLCILSGRDWVAVDRHIRSFAASAGIQSTEYNRLRTVICYAADLLGSRRRELDSWIWKTMSTRKADSNQRTLFNDIDATDSIQAVG